MTPMTRYLLTILLAAAFALAGCTTTDGDGTDDGADDGDAMDGGDGMDDGTDDGTDGGAGDEPTPVTIGFLSPLTGDYSGLGSPAENGAIMAVEKINAQRNAFGLDVSLVSGDTQLDADKGLQEFQRVVGEGAQFIVGALGSSVSLALQPEATSEQVVLMSPASTSPALSGPDHGYFYRVIANDSVQGPQAAGFIYDDFGAATVTVMFQQNDYATGLKDTFVPAFEDMGGTLAGDPVSFTSEQTTHGSQAQEAIDQGASFIWIAGQSGDAASVIKALRDQGFEGTIQTSEAIEDAEIFNVATTELNGTLFTKASPDLDSIAYRAFAAAYEARFGEAPGTYSAYAYDAVYVGATAIADTDNDGPAIKGWLDAGNTVSNRVTTSSISFNQNGDVTTGGYVLWEIIYEDGEGSFRPYGG